MKIPALFGLVALNVSGSVAAQDMSVPADPVAAIEGDWKGIWHEWEVRVTDGRVVLTKGDPKSYSWLPVGTVLGVLNNNGKSEPRMFRFSGSTCLDHRRDLPPSAYKAIPCGDYSATLGVFADSYELRVSGISLRRPKSAGGKRSRAAAEKRTEYGICKVLTGYDKLVSSAFAWPDSTMRDVEREWHQELLRKEVKNNGFGLSCEKFENLAGANIRIQSLEAPTNGFRRFDFAPASSSTATEANSSEQGAGTARKTADTTQPSEVLTSVKETAEARARAREEREARNREKQAKYEADIKAWQDQIDAQKAEEERKKAEFERDKQQAAQKLAAFASEQEAHRQEMERAAEQLRKYQDAQRHHALCTAGDRSACEALAKLQTAGAAVPKDAGEASTDDDARQCVTEPVLSPSEVWKGALKAVVVNGCAKPVDVRICLMRTGGWNCGMMLGLKPQEDWTWWTMNPQDGVFWDARTSGTNRKLASPAG